MGAQEGIPEAVRQAAYDASRAALHDGRVAVAAPDGLAALLDRRPAGVRCVLVTNAPVAGIEPLLDRLGLTGRFDALVGDAGKPAGLPPILADLLDGVAPDHLLAVGDVWINDLAPAAAIGAATAYVDRFGRGDGRPTYRAASTVELLADIEAWWSA